MTSLSRRQLLFGASAALVAGAHLDRRVEEKPIKVPTVNEQLATLAAEAPLAMKFTGKTAADCRKWQGEFATRLRALLGPHDPPAKWKTVVERRVDLKDHQRAELVLQARGFPPLPVYLLTPRGKAARPRPAVLALHGHGPYGHDPVAGCDDRAEVARQIRNVNYDYGRQLVRRGYVVAVPCLTPFGRRLGAPRGSKVDACADTFIRMQMLGKLLMAENLRDCRWALDLLARDEQVDGKRLACVGLSYGGRMTMLTAALDSRVRVAVISGALNVMQERIGKPYSCGAQIIPGLLRYGDVPEIASLIAPRPCLWEVGSRDGLIAPKWAEEALKRIRQAYRALEAEKQLQIDRFDGGHVWNGKVAYPLLGKVLG
jgi:dienelactone hydrolase